MLTELPHDILILILTSLHSLDLASLTQTCKTFHNLVSDYGWSAYLRSHPRPSHSLVSARAAWNSSFRVQYDTLTDIAWSNNSFVARPLSNPWATKSSPLLSISANRLAVAFGTSLYSYNFNTDGSVSFEGSFSFSNGHDTHNDITGITLAHSDRSNDIFFIAFQDGLIECIILTPSPNSDFLNITRCHATTLGANDFSESLSSASHFLLSLSFNGSATLADHRDLTSIISHHHHTSTALHSTSLSSSPVAPSLKPSSTIDLRARSWASHLCLSSNTPFAAFGTSNPAAPLPIYHLGPDLTFPASGIPTVLLSTGKSLSSSAGNGTLTNGSSANPAIVAQSSGPLAPSSSAVYGLCQAPPSSPWGSSPQIIIGGWYDSKVRCYDLRLPSCSASSSTIPTLAPVLSLYNPWSYEPIYSVSCGGGSSAHIAAGSARHGVLSFWDVRSPREGWSVHAPGNDPSPVYSVILESSRCFGATESRPFVYDFGPGVTIDTYPPIMRVRGDKLKPHKTQGRKGIDFYVTKYLHSRGNTPADH